MNIQAPLGTFNFLTFMEIVIIYFTALFSSTLLGELILNVIRPLKPFKIENLGYLKAFLT